MHTLTRSTYIFAICLSALAGYVDAVGFLQLGGYFISFMSGNSTRLAVNLVAGNFSSVLLLAGILISFVTGAMIGVLVRHFSNAKLIACNVLGCVTILLTLSVLSHEMGWNFAATMFMTLAMGAENAVIRGNGDIVGLTYMTGTLVKIGHRLASAVLGGNKFAWVPYIILWLGLVSGGIIGALLFHFLGMNSLWLAVAWAGSLTVIVFIFEARSVV